MCILLVLDVFSIDMDIRALSYSATPHNTTYTNDLSRACMWTLHGHATSSLEKLQAVRESLGCLQADEISWLNEKSHV